MWRSSGLILVFWLSRLQVFVWVMSLFITVVIRDLTYILLLCSMVTGFRLLDSDGRGGILLGFVLLLFLVFSGLIKRLGILGRSGYGSLSLRFVLAIIFHHSLGLNFVYSGVGRSIPSKDLLISLLYIRTRSSAHLGLDFHHFHY